MTTKAATFDLPPFEREVHRAVRDMFDGRGDVALALADMIPAERVKRMGSRLTKAAFRKGFIAGLSFAPDDPRFPECPYDRKRLPNFMQGDNDPRDAWREGSLNGQRIRSVVLCDGHAIVPGLQWREYKALTPEMRGAYDRLPQSSEADEEIAR